MTRIVIPTNNADCWKACTNRIHTMEPFVQDEDIVSVLDGVRPAWGMNDSDWTEGVSPFCFSRNVNRGISNLTELGDTYNGGVIILNHDALLETPGGFSSLVAWTDAHPEYGAVSAAIRGACCNPVQAAVANSSAHVIDTDVTVAFVCVYIPRRTLDAVGLLNESFTGYGFEDDLYCTQVRAAGLRVGVYHGCVVEHGSLPSSYRTQADCGAKMAQNHKLYHEIVREKGLEAFSTHHSWCKETF